MLQTTNQTVNQIAKNYVPKLPRTYDQGDPSVQIDLSDPSFKSAPSDGVAQTTAPVAPITTTKSQPIPDPPSSSNANTNIPRPTKDHAKSIPALGATTTQPVPKLTAPSSYTHGSLVYSYSSDSSSSRLHSSSPSTPNPAQHPLPSSQPLPKHNSAMESPLTSELGLDDSPPSSQEVDIFMLATADAMKRKGRGEQPLFDIDPLLQPIDCVGCGEKEDGRVLGVEDTDTIQCTRCSLWSHTACIETQFGNLPTGSNERWICNRCRGARIWDVSL